MSTYEPLDAQRALDEQLGVVAASAVRMRSLRRIAGLCVGLLMIVVLGVHPSARADASPSAAAAVIQDLQGVTRSLVELQGQPVLVNYWASWCGPCVKEMPELERFSQAQARHGVRVLGIANDEHAAVTAFLQRVPVTFPIWVETVPASGQGSAARFQATGGALPFSVLLDARGQLVRSKLGAVTVEEIEDWIRQAGPVLQGADAAPARQVTGH